MRRTCLRLLAAVTLGLVAGAAVGAPAVGPPAVSAPVAAQPPECLIERPGWEVSWTSDDAETRQSCGGEAEVVPVSADNGGSPSGAPAAPAAEDTADGVTDGVTDGGELPLTTGPAILVAGLAGSLIGLGAGLYLVTRRRRTTFTS